MKQQVTVREYDYLISDADSACGGLLGKRWAVAISPRAFEYLGRLLSREERKEKSDDYGFFLKRTSWGGKPALQLQSYVGVLQTPCGTQIEVLPKTSVDHEDENNLEQNRKMLFRMLRHLKSANFKQSGDAHLRKAPMHLLELFITYFLQEVNTLVKRGVRSDYVTKEENQAFLKGKLLVNQQVRVNAVQQQRFFCAYDEYLPDRPENRLIHRALEKVLKLSRNSNNQRLSRELMFVFADVPMSKNIRQDFAKCKSNRAMTHYQHPLEWCRLILNEESTVSSAGKTQTISILFPMEKIFEDYVAAMLNRALQPDYLVRVQSGGKHLVEKHQSKAMFALRPDLVIEQSGQRVCVADTKWKCIDQSDRAKNYGISQSDMYQLYAYATKYNCKRVVLIYPESDLFNQPLAPFDFGEGYQLHVVPFPLDHMKQENKFDELCGKLTNSTNGMDEK